MRWDLADQREVFFFYLAVISCANSTCKVKKGEDVDASYPQNFVHSAKITYGPSYIKFSRSVRQSADSSVMATSRKLIITVRLLNLTLTANLLLLSNDVSTNLGPIERGNLLYSPKDLSFSSTESKTRTIQFPRGNAFTIKLRAL